MKIHALTYEEAEFILQVMKLNAAGCEAAVKQIMAGNITAVGPEFHEQAKSALPVLLAQREMFHTIIAKLERQGPDPLGSANTPEEPQK